jgi:hypothetical protein
MLPPGYKDPAKETLANGRSIADIVGARGGKGMPGVIVAPAGIDGRAKNFNPHDRAQVLINIEPDSPNGQSLSLSQFKKQSVDRAISAASQKIAGTDINSIRERTAVAFEELAKIANSGVQNVPALPAGAAVASAGVTAQPVAPAAVSHPAPPPVPSTAYVSPENVDRTYSPMAAFGLKKTSQSAARPAPTAKNTTAGPPTKLLYFEKEGIGTVPAFFHDVVVDIDRADDEFNESGFIVLIYDLNFEQAAARWFPPANDPYKRPWAVQINNDRRLYLVHTTGFQYVYADREFCVLMVEKAVDAEL